MWLKFRMPVRSFFKVYEDSGILMQQLSPCARYLITIGSVDSAYFIDMWLWTLGDEVPHDSHKIDAAESGRPTKIAFNKEKPEVIMIVFEKRVCFLEWEPTTYKYVNKTLPEITKGHKIGNCLSGTFIQNSLTSYVSSSKGCILSFGTSLYFRDPEEGDLANDRVYIHAVKISDNPIGVLATTNGLLVAGDNRGHIYFFDSRIRIVYWFTKFTLASITSIAFNMEQRDYNYDDNTLHVEKLYLETPVCAFEDISSELAQTVSVEMPRDVSIKMEPLMMNDFFLSTTDSNVFAVNFLKRSCVSLFQISDYNITCIDAHDERPCIVTGHKYGRLRLINYEKKELISTYVLPKAHEELLLLNTITAIKYSPQSLHLVCGRANGEIWVLEPITLEPKSPIPFRQTHYNVMKIDFSYDSLQFAYYDLNRTVVLFKYAPQSNEWVFQGKIRAHYDDINDIMFYPDPTRPYLYTIANDRHIVEYNNTKSDEEDFGIKSCQRLEQVAIPVCFVYYATTVNDKQIGYFLQADNQYKLKLLHEVTRVPRSTGLGPAYGCFSESHIRKMRILPDCDMRYMVFMCKRYMGIMILPPDGNPYKFIGYAVHPTEVTDFVISYDGKYLFTFGENDKCVLKWDIITESLETLHQIGGQELEPYYCLLDGGKRGFLFQEMQDLFFYMQLLEEQKIDLPRQVSDNISLSEVPDLIRSCGFFPTDFEIETMIIDIRYRDWDTTGQVRDEMTFIEFVKLFINHKPVHNHTMQEIKDAFLVITKMAEYPKRGKIDSRTFVRLLQTRGDADSSFPRYLRTLLGEPLLKDEEKDKCDFLPSMMDTKYVIENMLGIEPTKSDEECELALQTSYGHTKCML